MSNAAVTVCCSPSALDRSSVAHCCILRWHLLFDCADELCRIELAAHDHDTCILTLLAVWGASPTLAAMTTVIISFMFTASNAAGDRQVGSRSALLQYALPIAVCALVALLQYALTVYFNVVGAYRPHILSSIRRTFHCCSNMSSAATVITALAYDLCFGVWWDPLAPENADWKVIRRFLAARGSYYRRWKKSDGLVYSTPHSWLRPAATAS